MANSGISATSATAAAAVPTPRELAERQRLPRIVLVLPTYIPESFGGAEQQSRKLALALGRLGMPVKVLAPRLLPSTPRREQEGTVSLERFRLRYAPNLGGRHIGSFVAWGAKLLWWLLKHRHSYDLIHIVHGRLHAVPAVLAGSLLGKPTLIKIGRGGVAHFDLDIVNRKRLLGQWYARVLVRHASGYVANSQEIAEDLLRWNVPISNIHRIPNGVDISADFARDRGPRVRFIYLGRLDPEKAIDVMIQGFARLADRSRASLTIIGDGECRRSLEDLVDRLQLRDTVVFAGAVRDVGPALRQTDVFVSTSLSEGMSNALLEAMSFGLMPLVSRVSGVAEIVADGHSGLLFRPGDAGEFASKLEETLSLPCETRESFGNAARAAVAGRFGIDQVAAQHVVLYQDLLREAAAP
jgi:glycosyltransferase involved in cell wall biosynthesis